MAAGATLGILMLDTRFPRIPGDIGNPATWPFAVQYSIVPGATPNQVIGTDPWPQAQAFVAAGRALVASGCDGIATTCGFLVPLQDRLAEAIGVPVASSALLQVPWVARLLPAGQRPGILTISAQSLAADHLAAAGVPVGTPVMGTPPEGEFATKILGNAPDLDIAAARADVIEGAERLVAAHPDVGAIVLECTNMVPYAPDVQRATGRPVYSVYTLLVWFQGALHPRRFAEAGDAPA